MNVDSEDVADYLRTHPEFFENHAELLAEMQIPHPHAGSAIPISERQIAALRDKNHLLQEKLSQLIRFGEENDAIADKMHCLAVSLIKFKGLSDLVHGLNFSLRESFSVPHTVLRLWDTASEDPGLKEFSPTTTDIHVMAENLAHPYCGSYILDEIRDWFREDGTRLRSFAMVSLRAEGTIGVLVMGSEDSQRFYPEMGTVYLTRLGELLSASLRRLAEDTQSRSQSA